MKRLFSAIIILCAAISAQATVVLTEDFNYTAGSALEGQGTPNKWTVSTNTNNAQTASVPLTVSASGLTMEYYGAGDAATGLGVTMPQVTLSPESSRQRVTYKMFDTNSSYKTGSLYAAFPVVLGNLGISLHTTVYQEEWQRLRVRRDARRHNTRMVGCTNDRRDLSGSIQVRDGIR